MTNLLSIHLIPAHMRTSDFEYAVNLQPRVVKIVSPDPNIVQRLYPALPGALYFLRDHAMSEQHEDMAQQPEATGQRHAREWSARIRAFGVPLAQVIVPGINEPHVWDHLAETVRYYAAFCDACTGYGMRAAALNLSVGWPANQGGETPPDWAPYAPVHDAIKRGNHVLCVHEYFDHRGPDFNWGWWCGRIQANTWDVPIVIGECGLDEYVSNPAVSQHQRGWQGHMGSTEYAAALERYCNRIGADGRVLGACPFTTDFGGREWQSFDTDPAHGQLQRVYVPAGPGHFYAPPVVEPTPEPEPEPEPPLAAAAGLVHPCAGAPITQHWGEGAANYARFGLWGHNGTDFGCQTGTPILACADGEVVIVDEDAAYGLYVRVWHAQLRCHSFYCHLSQQVVMPGQVVSAGAVLGLSGNTGNSTGPHLHLEIRLGERHAYSRLTPMPKGRIDPETFFAINGVGL